MKKQNINGLQLFDVLVGFEFGTAIILGIGSGAKQDAWLAILISMLSSLILMGVFTQLSLYYPNDTLVSMLPKIIGKFLSYPLIILYISHFIYSAARACRDFGDLITSTMLVKTPIIVVIVSFMLLIIYCLRGGVEAFGRMGEMVFPIYIMSLIIIWILLLSVEDFNLKNLTPIMGNGLKPIIKEVYPGIINFPFGEMIIIMMFFPFLNSKKIIRKVGMTIILVSGLILTINSILILSVIGPEIYGENWFPFFTATQMVSIADFLERFDALVILMMVSGVFFKVGGWTFGAAVGISQLVKLNHTKSVLLGLGTIIPPLSLLIAPNFSEHLKIGLDYFVPYFHVPLQIIIPILLLCIAFIRKKFKF
ncbi:spore gernimation protein KB [Bacillus sp. SA1-12]|uniref:GerAB/ArcD/ProY family transporter n=1 Tax=Bacillus sp. SA1-12 TaxID=1455638 RepID=UPI0006271896|nr:endospore germination permease [Bacillus sp. SA1-12]KKI90564.1 spore gernimation protein KB [Bacillus sp. SA1-12]